MFVWILAGLMFFIAVYFLWPGRKDALQELYDDASDDEKVLIIECLLRSDMGNMW